MARILVGVKRVIDYAVKVSFIANCECKFLCSYSVVLLKLQCVETCVAFKMFLFLSLLMFGNVYLALGHKTIAGTILPLGQFHDKDTPGLKKMKPKS